MLVALSIGRLPTGVAAISSVGPLRHEHLAAGSTGDLVTLGAASGTQLPPIARLRAVVAEMPSGRAAAGVPQAYLPSGVCCARDHIFLAAGERRAAAKAAGMVGQRRARVWLSP